MAVFEYKALAGNGRQTKGVIDAENVRQARTLLRDRGLYPTTINETSSKESSKSWNVSIDFRRRGVSVVALAVATRQLATLLMAGMPLVESLRSLSKQLDHPTLRQIVAEVGDSVNEGGTMADAIRTHPEVFPRLYVNMVAAGEASGSLDVVLERLADLLEGQASLRRKIVSAMIYPVLMLVLCFGVIVLLLGFVVPQLTTIFKDKGQTLPFATQVVMSMSDFVQNFWYLLVAVILLAFLGVRSYIRSPAGREHYDRVRLKVPLFGTLALKISCARFTRNLGTMLSSGIELLSALSIAKNIAGNIVLEKAIETAADGVREGQSLSKELGKSNVFPLLLVQMIAIGERSGQLEAMLLRVAQSYESEIDATVNGLTSLLEPILILFLACIVGGILASVMLPMLDMSALAGS